MNATHIWQRSGWAFAAMFVGGVIGGALTLAHVRAAPVEVSKGANTSPEREIESAIYVPNTLALYTLRGPSGDGSSEPAYLLTAKVKLGLLDSGKRVPREIEVFGHMYITDKELDEVPGPMTMIKAEDDVLCQPISIDDAELGILQLRRALNPSSDSVAEE